MRELAGLCGSGMRYVTGNAYGYEDTILIHKDKNSNTRGVHELAADARPLSSLLEDIQAGRVTHVIALGGATPRAGGTPGTAGAEPDTDRETLGRAKLVAVAAHDGPITKAARVVLPATSWAEHSGTYANAKGLRQVAERALLPQGASKPAWEQLVAVAGALGLAASWTKLKQIRQELAIDHAERPAAEPITTGVTMGIV